MLLHKNQFVPILLVMVLMGLLASCQSVPTLASPSAPGISVGITSDGCPLVEVQVGQQVTWTNQDSRDHIVRHTPDEGNSQFDSGILGTGDSFAFTFTQPGEYAYACSLNGGAVGVITVQQ